MAIRKLKYLYHTTKASNLRSILEHGLSPLKAGKWIYLAVDAGQSRAYAAQYLSQPVVLLRVKVSEIDQDLLGPDDDDLPDLLYQQGDERSWQCVGWRESLRISGQATYDGVIPPTAIEVLGSWIA